MRSKLIIGAMVILIMVETSTVKSKDDLGTINEMIPGEY